MIQVKVEGLTELKDLLERKLPEHIQTKALQSSLLKAAQPIVADAKSRVPVKTGNLRRAIYSFRSRKSTKQKAVRMISVRPARRQGQKPTFYWRWIEFGRGAIETAKRKSLGNSVVGWFGKSVKAVPAQPFLRPAFEAKKYEALERFRVSMAGEIQKAAVRFNNSVSRKILRKFGL